MSEPSLEGKHWTWIFPKTPEVNLSRFAGKGTRDSTKEQAGGGMESCGAWLIGGPGDEGRGLPDDSGRKGETLRHCG